MKTYVNIETSSTILVFRKQARVFYLSLFSHKLVCSRLYLLPMSEPNKQSLGIKKPSATSNHHIYSNYYFDIFNK